MIFLYHLNLYLPNLAFTLIAYKNYNLFKWHIIRIKKYYQLLESTSDGILKSPLGETLTVPTLGPSGRQFLLN